MAERAVCAAFEFFFHGLRTRSGLHYSYCHIPLPPLLPALRALRLSFPFDLGGASLAASRPCLWRGIINVFSARQHSSIMGRSRLSECREVQLQPRIHSTARVVRRPPSICSAVIFAVQHAPLARFGVPQFSPDCTPKLADRRPSPRTSHLESLSIRSSVSEANAFLCIVVTPSERS
jgi:hypothetical protein